jgi:NADH:ubiquinone reductase (H+-translocating)
MAKNILIIGSGFAGLMAALSASRLRYEKGVSPDDMTITVISPEPVMVIRPRLYERDPATMLAPLEALFAATDIAFLAGLVETIDSDAGEVVIADSTGNTHVMSYDRLVVAAGSHGFQPPIPGLADFGFAVSDFDGAAALDRHLNSLAGRPDSAARNTVVVGGGGFTGIEVATEMPGRLREILGQDASVRIIIVERGPSVAKDMGDGAYSYIAARLRELGVETRVGVGIVRIDATGATLEDGERIEAATVIWSAGMRASSLTAQLPAELDNFGRVLVEPDLRVPGAPHVFATGDTAKAATDDKGNFSLMSCQHARRLGAFAGHNAAADLLGEPTLPYNQPSYLVCLDLGPDAAIVTRGWSRDVEVTGADAKKMKTEVNTAWIYPPQPNREAAYANALYAQTVDF